MAASSPGVLQDLAPPAVPLVLYRALDAAGQPVPPTLRVLKKAGGAVELHL